MDARSIANDPVVQNVLKIGGVLAVLAAIALVAGIVTGNRGVNVLTQAGVFVLAVWSVSFIAALIIAARRRR